MPVHLDVVEAMEDEGSIELIEEDMEEDDEIEDDLTAVEASTSEAKAHESGGKIIASQTSEKFPKPPSRKTKQRSGSMRGSRTRGRRSVKDWGNASSPAISIKDIMGGERKATHVGLVDAPPGQGTVKAEAKLVNIRKMKGAKKERRRDVKNSLAHFLHANEQEVSEYEEDEEEEDESLISEEDGGPKPDEIISENEKSDGEGDMSIKSQKSHSRRRRRVRRVGGKEDGGRSSSHSRKRGPRRRGKGDGDDATVSSLGRRERSRSRRSSRRIGGTDGDPQQRRRRPVGDSHSLDGSELQRRRPVADTASLDGSTMSRRRRTTDDGDDVRSVGSRKSVGRRRRLKSEARPARKKSAQSVKKSTGDPSAVRNVDRRTSVDCEGLQEPIFDHEEKPDSIPRKISVCRSDKHHGELDESESSNLSLMDQPALIQFDPNNENHFTLVNQSKGNITSETIRNADGTESEFHITELEGLPTFEIPPPAFHDSFASAISDGPVPPVSTATIGSTACEGDGDTGGKNGVSNDQVVTETKSSENGEGDAGPGAARRIKRNKSGGKLRGVNSTTSFLQRMRGQKSAVVDFGESQKSFFSGWKKKEKDDSDEDEDAGGFFKKFEAKTHQALEDDGSDH